MFRVANENGALKMAYTCFTNWSSPNKRTSSLTITPPPSIAVFQVKPKSVRLIVPLRVKPAFVLPHGSVAIPPNSAVNRIGLVWFDL